MPIRIDWDVLLPALKNRRCVLILGSDAYPFSETESVEHAMWSKTTQDTDIVHKFYPDDGLILFKKKSNRGKFIDKVQNFFEQDSHDWSLTQVQLQKLVQLPFLAIINLTFDDLLVRNYTNLGLDYQFVNYVFRPSLTEKFITELPINRKSPLVLNLLGSIYSPDNLVLTHTDLFDFFKTFFDEKNEWLNELLHEADCFIFLGVSFEKWYIQLLMQELFKYTKTSDEAERYAFSEKKIVNMADLYKQELKIQFVEDEQQHVIEQLFRFCEEEGIVNKPKTPLKLYKTPFLMPIYRFILRGELDTAVKGFLDFSQQFLSSDKDLINGAIILSANLSHLTANSNTMTPREISIERNKIVKSLLYHLDLADNNPPK